jgi:hypothetical protein
MSAGLLKPGDLRRRLGLSTSAFFAAQKRGEFRRFEVKPPIGCFRYSAVLVDAFLEGKTVAHYGKRISA